MHSLQVSFYYICVAPNQATGAHLMLQLCEAVVKHARAATLGCPDALLRLHPQSDS